MGFHGKKMLYLLVSSKMDGWKIPELNGGSIGKIWDVMFPIDVFPLDEMLLDWIIEMVPMSYIGKNRFGRTGIPSINHHLPVVKWEKQTPLFINQSHQDIYDFTKKPRCWSRILMGYI